MATSATRCPTRVEPVKETMRTSGWPIRASPATGPMPVMTLNTPSGMPAAVASAASISEVSGVSSLGLSTIVFPAATAGSIFHIAICSG